MTNERYIYNFPEPLSNEEQDVVLSQIALGDKNAKVVLLEHTLRFCLYIADKFYNSNYEYDDLVSVAIIGLIKAVNTYSLDGDAKFLTYANKCIENEILMYMRAQKRHLNHTSLNENMLYREKDISDDNDVECYDVEKSVVKDVIIDELKNQIYELPFENRFILINLYGLYGHEKKSQMEVSSLLNKSQAYVSRSLKKSLDMLRKKF